MNNVENYSVIKSRLNIFEENNRKYITKEINLTALDKNSVKYIKDLTIRYIEKIKKAGIPLPLIKKHYIKDSKIFFVCEYKGCNLLQAKKKPVDLVKDTVFLDVVRILNKARKAKISIDPHMKNFVYSDKVYYVDFSPPYQEEYNDLVIKKTNESYKGLVIKNLDAFKPEMLGIHFAADLLKEDKSYLGIMQEIYEILLKEELVNLDYKQFLIKAEEIKNIEEERIRKKIFLI
ncbi:MAG: hypothetical protein ABIC04_00570 [Nanoarchaeota archaeon]